jgi:hypothetical protein
MERRSTKHGPARDEQLKHETEAMERGTPQRPHAEEWREVEPVGDIPAAERRAQGPGAQDIALRSDLARLLSRGDFPAERDTLLARLADVDAPAELIARLAGLTSDRRFASVHEVMVALGVNDPEHRAHRADPSI